MKYIIIINDQLPKDTGINMISENEIHIHPDHFYVLCFLNGVTKEAIEAAVNFAKQQVRIKCKLI